MTYQFLAMLLYLSGVLSIGLFISMMRESGEFQRIGWLGSVCIALLWPVLMPILMMVLSSVEDEDA